MPSLEMLSTSLGPCPARRTSGRTIVACALALLALAAGAVAQAEKKPHHRGGPHGGPHPLVEEARRRKALRAGAGADAGASAGAGAAAAKAEARPEGKVVDAPPLPPPARPKMSKADLEAWNRIAGELSAEYYAYHPDEAIREGWPKATALGLAGSGASRWRAALVRARESLDGIVLDGAPWSARAHARALSDWIEGEILLLDAQASSTRDPAAYVELAQRVLDAAAEAPGPTPEERGARIDALLAELPAYLERARLELLSSCAPWIDLALHDLDDLQEQIVRLERPRPEWTPPKSTPKKGKAPLVAPPPADPLQALDRFRAWLLAERENAPADPLTLDADEWRRLVRSVSGTAWETGELKARCLRDLARIEPQDASRIATRSRLPAPRRLTLRAKQASLGAFSVAHEAKLLRMRPKSVVEFGAEESARSDTSVVAIRPGAEGTPRVYLQLPNHAWPAGLTTARNHELDMLDLAAIGVRDGLTGEAFFERTRRADDDPLRFLPVNREQSRAIGLFAQDWLVRVDWVDNPLGASARLRRAFELQRGLEAARFLAALELHSEGLSPDEAAASFQRRTGVDEDVAQAEVLSALRDPLHGIGYLGLLELRAVEQRFVGLTTPRRGLALTLLLTYRHPVLRASDLGTAPAGALRSER